jgi:DNA-3-methyladenine glycosylase
MMLERTFYTRRDVVQVARDLLGKMLFTKFGGNLTGGFITETEAYAGISDRASHAWNGHRSKRTEVMYREGGIAYIYFCYGVHSLFNIVTDIKGIPNAILVRGFYPTHGIGTMLERTSRKALTRDFGNGPGKLSRALGMHYSQTGTSLIGKEIWLEDRGIVISEKDFATGSRIGVDYAGDDAKLPYRFTLKPEVIEELASKFR